MVSCDGHARYMFWRGKCRQVQSSGSMVRRVLGLSSPMMAETMCSFTSAPLRERVFLGSLKVRRLPSKPKLTLSAVKPARKTSRSDEQRQIWRSISFETRKSEPLTLCGRGERTRDERSCERSNCGPQEYGPS